MNNSIEEVQRAVRDLSGFTIKDQCSHVKNQEMSRWLAAGYLVCKDLGYTIGEISKAWNRAYTGPHKTMERLARDPLYFAKPDRALFQDIRRYFPITAQAEVAWAVQEGVAAASAFIEKLKDGEERGLGIQRIEDRFDQQQVYTAVEQAPDLITIGGDQLLVRQACHLVRDCRRSSGSPTRRQLGVWSTTHGRDAPRAEANQYRSR